jgi:hypothetical protein
MARISLAGLTSHDVLAKHIKGPNEPRAHAKAGFPLPPKIPGIASVTAAPPTLGSLPKLPKNPSAPKLPRKQGGGAS